jgi:hypothetical protein
MYANKMNKKGDSYLPCIAMAHSPQVRNLCPWMNKYSSVKEALQGSPAWLESEIYVPE